MDAPRQQGRVEPSRQLVWYGFAIVWFAACFVLPSLTPPFWILSLFELYLICLIFYAVPEGIIREQFVYPRFVLRYLSVACAHFGVRQSLSITDLKSSEASLLVYWADVVLTLVSIRILQFVEGGRHDLPLFVAWVAVVAVYWCAAVLWLALGAAARSTGKKHSRRCYLTAVYSVLLRRKPLQGTPSCNCDLTAAHIEKQIGRMSPTLVYIDCGLWAVLALITPRPLGTIALGLFLMTAASLIEEITQDERPIRLMLDGCPSLRFRGLRMLIRSPRRYVAHAYGYTFCQITWIIGCGGLAAWWQTEPGVVDSIRHGMFYGLITGIGVVVIAVWRLAERLNLQTKLAREQSARAADSERASTAARIEAEQQRSSAEEALARLEEQSERLSRQLHNVAHTARASRQRASSLVRQCGSNHEAALAASMLMLIGEGALAAYSISLHSQDNSQMRSDILLSAPTQAESENIECVFETSSLSQLLENLLLYETTNVSTAGHPQVASALLAGRISDAALEEAIGSGRLPDGLDITDVIRRFVEEHHLISEEVALSRLVYRLDEGFPNQWKRMRDFSAGFLGCVNEIIFNALEHAYSSDEIAGLRISSRVMERLGQQGAHVIVCVSNGMPDAAADLDESTGSGLAACTQFAYVFGLRFCSTFDTSGDSGAVAQIRELIEDQRRGFSAFCIPVSLGESL